MTTFGNLVVQVGGFALPCAPQDVEIVSEGVAVSYDVIARGEILLPRGRKARRYRLRGVLFGEALADLPFIRGRWQDPGRIVAGMRVWAEEGEDDERPLLIAGLGTSVADTVHLQRASFGVSGAYGNVPYTLDLYEARPLSIGAAGSASRGFVARPGGGRPGTYTTTGRDTWWSAAQRATGDGANWATMRDLNPLEPADAPRPGATLVVPPRVQGVE